MGDPSLREAFRDYIFPPQPTGECNQWCAPLHLVERAVAGADYAEHFSVDDFMVMAAIRRKGKPLLYLYKHGFTRRYLNVDESGQVWRYVSPRTARPGDRGRYVRLPDVRAAVEELGLWRLPTMAGWSPDDPTD